MVPSTALQTNRDLDLLSFSVSELVEGIEVIAIDVFNGLTDLRCPNE